VRLFKRGCACLYRHAPGDLTHRLKQRQAALSASHGFIGNADDAAFEEVCGLFGIRSEVQIGVKDLISAEHGAFARLRFLYLYDHFGAGKNRRRITDYLGACCAVVRISRTDAHSGTRFNNNLMPVRRQFARTFRGETDAIFVIFDFFGAADQHHFSPLLCAIIFQARFDQWRSRASLATSKG
jgi:hypothetical protein